MKAPIVGIDLGTTNSSIAAFINGAIRVIDIQGSPTMPSCVGLDPSGRLIVGTPARNQAIAARDATLFSVKRHMGEDIRLPALPPSIPAISPTSPSGAPGFRLQSHK